MLMIKERRPVFKTVEGWARGILLETGAIRECEEHGWTSDLADPHAREHAVIFARDNPPFGLTPGQAVAALDEIFGSIGDTCPECPPDV